MPRLRDRNKQTPGGHKFYDPVLKYRSRSWASIDDIARGLVQARLGNPALTQQHGWSTDFNVVVNEVDQAIARHCQQMGWHSYVMADAPGGDAHSAPFSEPLRQHPQSQRLLGRLKNAAVGASVIIDFGLSKEEAVSIHHAKARANICIECKFNEMPKSWLDHFTTSVSEWIRRGFEKLKQWNLPVPHQDKLGRCTKCDCPLGLKVYFPIKKIREGLDAEVQADLPEWCWIREEVE